MNKYLYDSLGIYWKLNGGRLENKWIGTWEYSHKSWILPKEGATPDYIRMSHEDIDYTEDGEACETRCGNEGMYNGRNWCWKVSGSWNYCAKGIHCRKSLTKQEGPKPLLGYSKNELPPLTSSLFISHFGFCLSTPCCFVLFNVLLIPFLVT